jgi:hypothetical protein
MISENDGVTCQAAVSHSSRDEVDERLIGRASVGHHNRGLYT